MTAGKQKLERSVVINCDSILHEAGALGVYIFKHKGDSISESICGL